MLIPRISTLLRLVVGLHIFCNSLPVNATSASWLLRVAHTIDSPTLTESILATQLGGDVSVLRVWVDGHVKYECAECLDTLFENKVPPELVALGGSVVHLVFDKPSSQSFENVLSATTSTYTRASDEVLVTLGITHAIGLETHDVGEWMVPGSATTRTNCTVICTENTTALIDVDRSESWLIGQRISHDVKMPLQGEVYSLHFSKSRSTRLYPSSIYVQEYEILQHETTSIIKANLPGLLELVIEPPTAFADERRPSHLYSYLVDTVSAVNVFLVIIASDTRGDVYTPLPAGMAVVYLRKEGFEEEVVSYNVTKDNAHGKDERYYKIPIPEHWMNDKDEVIVNVSVSLVDQSAKGGMAPIATNELGLVIVLPTNKVPQEPLVILELPTLDISLGENCPSTTFSVPLYGQSKRVLTALSGSIEYNSSELQFVGIHQDIEKTRWKVRHSDGFKTFSFTRLDESASEINRGIRNMDASDHSYEYKLELLGTLDFKYIVQNANETKNCKMFGHISELRDLGVIGNLASEPIPIYTRDRFGISNSRPGTVTFVNDKLIGIYGQLQHNSHELYNIAVINGKKFENQFLVQGITACGVTAGAYPAICTSSNESILKISNDCTSVMLDGSELSGGNSVAISISTLDNTTTSEVFFRVWYPQQIELVVAGAEGNETNLYAIPGIYGEQCNELYFQNTTIDVVATLAAIGDPANDNVTHLATKTLVITDIVQSLLTTSNDSVVALYGAEHGPGLSVLGKNAGSTNVTATFYNANQYPPISKRFDVIAEVEPIASFDVTLYSSAEIHADVNSVTLILKPDFVGGGVLNRLHSHIHVQAIARPAYSGHNFRITQEDGLILKTTDEDIVSVYVTNAEFVAKGHGSGPLAIAEWSPAFSFSRECNAKSLPFASASVYVNIRVPPPRKFDIDISSTRITSDAHSAFVGISLTASITSVLITDVTGETYQSIDNPNLQVKAKGMCSLIKEDFGNVTYTVVPKEYENGECQIQFFLSTYPQIYHKEVIKVVRADRLECIANPYPAYEFSEGYTVQKLRKISSTLPGVYQMATINRILLLTDGDRINVNSISAVTSDSAAFINGSLVGGIPLAGQILPYKITVTCILGSLLSTTDITVVSSPTPVVGFERARVRGIHADTMMGIKGKQDIITFIALLNDGSKYPNAQNLFGAYNVLSSMPSVISVVDTLPTLTLQANSYIPVNIQLCNKVSDKVCPDFMVHANLIADVGDVDIGCKHKFAEGSPLSECIPEADGTIAAEIRINTGGYSLIHVVMSILFDSTCLKIVQMDAGEGIPLSSNIIVKPMGIAHLSAAITFPYISLPEEETNLHFATSYFEVSATQQCSNKPHRISGQIRSLRVDGNITFADDRDIVAGDVQLYSPQKQVVRSNRRSVYTPTQAYINTYAHTDKQADKQIDTNYQLNVIPRMTNIMIIPSQLYDDVSDGDRRSVDESERIDKDGDKTADVGVGMVVGEEISVHTYAKSILSSVERRQPCTNVCSNSICTACCGKRPSGDINADCVVSLSDAEYLFNFDVEARRGFDTHRGQQMANRTISDKNALLGRALYDSSRDGVPGTVYDAQLIDLLVNRRMPLLVQYMYEPKRCGASFGVRLENAAGDAPTSTLALEVYFVFQTSNITPNNSQFISTVTRFTEGTAVVQAQRVSATSDEWWAHLQVMNEITNGNISFSVILLSRTADNGMQKLNVVSLFRSHSASVGEGSVLHKGVNLEIPTRLLLNKLMMETSLFGYRDSSPIFDIKTRHECVANTMPVRVVLSINGLNQNQTYFCKWGTTQTMGQVLSPNVLDCGCAHVEHYLTLYAVTVTTLLWNTPEENQAELAVVSPFNWVAIDESLATTPAAMTIANTHVQLSRPFLVEVRSSNGYNIPNYERINGTEKIQCLWSVNGNNETSTAAVFISNDGIQCPTERSIAEPGSVNLSIRLNPITVVNVGSVTYDEISGEWYTIQVVPRAVLLYEDMMFTITLAGIIQQDDLVMCDLDGVTSLLVAKNLHENSKLPKTYTCRFSPTKGTDRKVLRLISTKANIKIYLSNAVLIEGYMLPTIVFPTATTKPMVAIGSTGGITVLATENNTFLSYQVLEDAAPVPRCKYIYRDSEDPLADLKMKYVEGTLVSATELFCPSIQMSRPVPAELLVLADSVNGQGPYPIQFAMRAPILLSAKIGDNFEGVLLLFDSPIDLMVSKCNDLMNEEYVKKLGVGHECRMTGQNRVLAKFGSNPTLVENDVLTIKPKAVYASVQPSLYASGSVSTAIAATPKVKIFFSGPYFIGPCDNFTLSAASTMGGGGRPMSYKWENNSPTPLTLHTNGSSVMVIGNDVPVDKQMSISLTVVNWLGKTSMLETRFQKKSVGVPVIYLESQTVEVTRDKVAVVRTRTQLRGCEGVKFPNPLIYAWSVDVESNADVSAALEKSEVWKSSVNSSTLVVPPYVLPAGEYFFKLTLTDAMTGEVFFDTMKDVISIKVSVKALPVQARLPFNALRFARENGLKLDGSESRKLDLQVDDEAAYTGLQYKWTCTYLDGDIPANPCDIDSVLTNLSTLTIDPAVMKDPLKWPEGRYLFVLSVTDSGSNPTSDSTSTIATLASSSLPVVSVKRQGYSGQVIGSQVVASVDFALNLVCETTATNVQWHSTSQATDGYSSFGRYNTTSRSRVLYIGEYALERGLKYTFECRGWNDDYNIYGASSLNIETAVGPSAGTVLVNDELWSDEMFENKHAVVQYGHEMKIKCLGWMASAGDFSLNYEFGYIARKVSFPNGVVQLKSMSSQYNLWGSDLQSPTLEVRVPLPPADTPLQSNDTYWITVIVLGKDSQDTTAMRYRHVQVVVTDYGIPLLKNQIQRFKKRLKDAEQEGNFWAGMSELSDWFKTIQRMNQDTLQDITLTTLSSAPIRTPTPTPPAPASTLSPPVALSGPVVSSLSKSTRLVDISNSVTPATTTALPTQSIVPFPAEDSVVDMDANKHLRNPKRKTRRVGRYAENHTRQITNSDELVSQDVLCQDRPIVEEILNSYTALLLVKPPAISASELYLAQLAAIVADNQCQTIGAQVMELMYTALSDYDRVRLTNDPPLSSVTQRDILFTCDRVMRAYMGAVAKTVTITQWRKSIVYALRDALRGQTCMQEQSVTGIVQDNSTYTFFDYAVGISYRNLNSAVTIGEISYLFDSADEKTNECSDIVSIVWRGVHIVNDSDVKQHEPSTTLVEGRAYIAKTRILEDTPVPINGESDIRYTIEHVLDDEETERECLYFDSTGNTWIPDVCTIVRPDPNVILDDNTTITSTSDLNTTDTPAVAPPADTGFSVCQCKFDNVVTTRPIPPQVNLAMRILVILLPILVTCLLLVAAIVLARWYYKTHIKPKRDFRHKYKRQTTFKEENGFATFQLKKVPGYREPPPFNFQTDSVEISGSGGGTCVGELLLPNVSSSLHPFTVVRSSEEYLGGLRSSNNSVSTTGRAQYFYGEDSIDEESSCIGGSSGLFYDTDLSDESRHANEKLGSQSLSFKNGYVESFERFDNIDLGFGVDKEDDSSANAHIRSAGTGEKDIHDETVDITDRAHGGK
eukprot:CFRG6187T1